MGVRIVSIRDKTKEEEDLEERQRIEDEYNAKMAARRSSMNKSKQKQAVKKSPEPTAAGKALLNAPSGFQNLVNVLGQQKKKD